MENLAIRPSPVLRRIQSALALSCLAGFAGCATLSGGGGSLGGEVKAIISAPTLDQVHWGILVKDLASGETLYSRNAHRKFVPASNMKVLSTAAALSLLGPGFRYETSLWRVGEISAADGVLEGDLVLRASGDPTFSERFYPSATSPLASMAEGLWTAGIRTITGALVVDASAWDSTTVPDSWMVGNLTGTSGATGGAFSIAEGEITLEITGGERPGDPAQLRWWPETAPGFLNAVFVTEEGARGRRRIDYLPETHRLLVQGTIAPGAVDTIATSQRDPVPLAANALLAALERRGIRVEGGLRIAWEREEPVGAGRCGTGPEARPERGDTIGAAAAVSGAGSLPTLSECSEASLITALSSPPLSEIIEAILEPSQNWMTEQLVRTLGAELRSEGSWSEGFEVEEAFLTETVGVDTLDLTFRDGSGLSAYNLVTPRAMVRILEYMAGSPHGELYRNALAEPGEDPGTLRNRLRGLEGRVFAKTGTITHVNSLSGYLTTATGRRLAFSVLSNGSGLSSASVREGIDRIVEAVARR